MRTYHHSLNSDIVLFCVDPITHCSALSDQTKINHGALWCNKLLLWNFFVLLIPAKIISEKCWFNPMVIRYVRVSPISFCCPGDYELLVGSQQYKFIGRQVVTHGFCPRTDTTYNITCLPDQETTLVIDQHCVLCWSLINTQPTKL